MKNKQLTWRQFDTAVDRMAKYLETLNPFVKNIYGVPRGGLMLAIALSHRLDKPLIYDRKKITDKTVIVDDIIDSGQTFLRLIKGNKYKGYLRLVTWVATEKNDHHVSFHVIVAKQGEWYQFPWETTESSKYDKTKF